MKPEPNPDQPIILLDLNYTLIENCDDFPSVPFPKRIEHHRYRQWLVELVRPYRVFILTARPEVHRERTLDALRRLTGWTPERYYGNTRNERPPEAKRRMLLEHLLPEFGIPQEGAAGSFALKHPVPFLGIESNPRTRTMYAKFAIPSLPCLELNLSSNPTQVWRSLATGPSRTLL